MISAFFYSQTHFLLLQKFEIEKSNCTALAATQNLQLVSSFVSNAIALSSSH